MAATDQTPGSGSPSTPDVDAALRPFQEAFNKFLQSNAAVMESAFKQRAQAWLDRQEEAHQVGQDAHRHLMDATRRFLDQLGERKEGTSAEQLHSARSKAQDDYEKEVRRVCTDAQTRLAEIGRKAFEESNNPEAGREVASQRQKAYQSYMDEVQQAWSGTRNLDPQTVNAIASHVLSTINMASQV